MHSIRLAQCTTQAPLRTPITIQHSTRLLLFCPSYFGASISPLKMGGIFMTKGLPACPMFVIYSKFNNGKLSKNRMRGKNNCAITSAINQMHL